MPITDRVKIENVLKIVQEDYPSYETVLKVLTSGKKLRIYHGIDPTSGNLHIGHAIPLRLLANLQELGHQAIVLIGDFTATVGDPSGRDRERKVLTREEVEQNALSIREQIGKILDIKNTEIRFNSEWYDDPEEVGSLRQFLKIAHYFTAAQLWERDLFQVRQQKQQPVSVTEFLYPVLQAYDTIELKADAEIGGNDQTFNMLAGRTIAKQINKIEKLVLTTPLILGTDGRKMSKSYGNVISLTDEPNDMYGKVMSVNDSEIKPYFQLILGRFLDGLKELDSLLPRDAKALLAREMVTQFYNSVVAESAEEAFVTQFKNRETPNDIPEIKLDKIPDDVVSLILTVGAAASKTEASRLIKQGGVIFNDQRIEDPKSTVLLSNSSILKVGKRRFYKITVK